MPEPLNGKSGTEGCVLRADNPRERVAVEVTMPHVADFIEDDLV
jgi:hypothetical protein